MVVFGQMLHSGVYDRWMNGSIPYALLAASLLTTNRAPAAPLVVGFWLPVGIVELLTFGTPQHFNC